MGTIANENFIISSIGVKTLEGDKRFAFVEIFQLVTVPEAEI